MDYHHLSNITNTTTDQVNFNIFFTVISVKTNTKQFLAQSKKTSHLSHKLASTSVTFRMTEMLLDSSVF